MGIGDERQLAQKVRYGAVEAYMSSVVCSLELRRLLIRCHPVVEQDLKALRYALIALFGQTDTDSGRPLIGKPVLEWVDGRAFRGERWGQHVLSDLRELFPGMEVRDYVPRKKSRQLQRDGLDPRVTERKRLEDTTALEEAESPVMALTGASCNRRSVRDQRNALREHLMVLNEDAPSETCRYVLNRMNDRPSNLFTRYIPRRVREAHGAVDAHFSRSDQDADAIRNRDAYRATLKQIEVQPQPFYSFSSRERTDRVFSANLSLLTLPRAVRETLLQDFTNVDLRSAQLVIAAALWDCGVVLDEIQKPGFSIWDELRSYFRVDSLINEEAEWQTFKSAFKSALYSVIFGMEESNIRGGVTRSLGELFPMHQVLVKKNKAWEPQTHVTAEQFVEHELISELLFARDAAIERIEEAGGAQTATGINATLDPGNGRDAKSLLATVAQSYEQEIMAEILRYEAEHFADVSKPDFRVAVWIHDGAAIRFTRRKATHLREMRERVSRRAKDLLGVGLYLE